METPPSYVDLGKQAHDIFNQGYHFGYWRIDCKTRTKRGIKLLTLAHSTPIERQIYGAFAIRHLVSRHLKFTEKWTTFNSVIGKIENVDNNPKLILEGLWNFVLSIGKAKITFSYGKDSCKMDTDFNFNSIGININASIVFSFGQWFVGYQTAIREQTSEFNPNNFALTYHTSDKDIFYASMNTDMMRERTKYELSFFKHCSDELDLAIQVSWFSSESKTNIGLGIKKHLDNGNILRAMINNDRQLGIGYQLALMDGFNLFLSTLIDSKNMRTQLGIAVELEA